MSSYQDERSKKIGEYLERLAYHPYNMDRSMLDGEPSGASQLESLGTPTVPEPPPEIPPLESLPNFQKDNSALDLLRSKLSAPAQPDPVVDGARQRLRENLLAKRAPAITEQPAPSQPDAPPQPPYQAPGFNSEMDDSALKGAQEAGRMQRLIARLGNANSTMIHGQRGGQKMDSSFYDNIEKGSNQAQQDVLTRRKGVTEEMTLESEQGMRDPQSPDNVAFREFIKAKVPALAASPSFGNLTLANPALSKIADMYMKSEDRASQMKIAQMNADAARAQREQSFQETQRHNRAMESLGKDKAAGTDRRFQTGKLQAYGEDLAKTGLPSMQETFKAIEEHLGPLDKIKDIPGYGRLEGSIPDFAIPAGAPAEKTRTLIQRLANVTLKDRSGAAVTDPEWQRFQKEFGTGTAVSDTRLVEGLKTAQRVMNRQMQAYEAALDPEMLEIYKSRQGAVSSSQPQGSAKIRVSNGQETLEIDAADLADAKKDGFQQVQ